MQKQNCFCVAVAQHKKCLFWVDWGWGSIFEPEKGFPFTTSDTLPPMFELHLPGSIHIMCKHTCFKCTSNITKVETKVCLDSFLKKKLIELSIWSWETAVMSFLSLSPACKNKRLTSCWVWSSFCTTETADSQHFTSSREEQRDKRQK